MFSTKFLVITVGTFFLGNFALQGAGASVCPNETDLVIIFDGSTGVSPEDYQHATHFAANVASYFMAPNRVAFITYSDSDQIHMEFGLSDNLSLSPQDVYLKITKHKHDPAGKGNTAAAGAAAAIEKAIEELEANARAGVPQKIVVFTDGMSTAPPDSGPQHTADAVAKAKGKNIITFSIAIGHNRTRTQAQKDELLKIAAGQAENSLKVDDKLEDLLNRIRSMSLAGEQYTKCEVSVDDIPEDCYSDNDLVIVLDSSGSVGMHDYRKATAFVSRLARAFGPPNRLGFITYSTNVTRRIALDSQISPEEIQDIIAAHPYDQGNTFTGGAIEEALKEFERTKRAGIAMKIVVLTDGESNVPSWEEGPKLTINAAEAVKAKHIIMFSVGIGPVAGQAEMKRELLAIAHGDEKNRFTVDTFNSLLNRIRELSKRICEVPPPPEITTTTERARLALGGNVTPF